MISRLATVIRYSPRSRLAVAMAASSQARHDSTLYDAALRMPFGGMAMPRLGMPFDHGTIACLFVGNSADAEQLSRRRPSRLGLLDQVLRTTCLVIARSCWMFTRRAAARLEEQSAQAMSPHNSARWRSAIRQRCPFATWRDFRQSRGGARFSSQ